jgi:hypothetical protein
MTVPSVIAARLRRGVEVYLRTTFPITTPHFEGLVERLFAEDRARFKGPYVSLGLPQHQQRTTWRHGDRPRATVPRDADRTMRRSVCAAPA